MNIQSNENHDINSDLTLKPELSFDWIKYKKTQSDKKTTFDDIAKFVHEKKLQSKQSEIQERHQDKIIEKQFTSEPQVSKATSIIQFGRDEFKNDPKKDRIRLWCEKIVSQKELTMEELSEAINIPDLIELEEI